MRRAVDTTVESHEIRHPQEAHSSRRARIVLSVLIVLLLVLLGALGAFFNTVANPSVDAVPTATGAESLDWIQSVYGFGPSTNDQLLRPTSVAFGPDGALYVTDPQQSRIMVFEPDGSFRLLIHTGVGGIGEGMLQRPESVDVSPAGEVYVADSAAGKVIVFNQSGAFVREWQVGDPSPIAGVKYYEGDDTVLVTGAGMVYAFSPSGSELGRFGTRGRAPGQIDAYIGIQADDEYVYIADALNHRVQALGHDGSPVWSMPVFEESAETTQGSAYDFPADLVIDGSGRLVVIDAFKNQVIVSERDGGDILVSYGDWGASDGLFAYPSGIDYDPGRDVFAVADTRNNRAQVFSIPDSGAPGAGVTRVVTGPYGYCAYPCAAAMLVLLIGVLASRHRRTRAGLVGTSRVDVVEDVIVP